MTKRRSTINVSRAVEMANSFLASVPVPENYVVAEHLANQRSGVCDLIEGILMETGNYAGFRYLDTDEVMGAGTRREYFMK